LPATGAEPVQTPEPKSMSRGPLFGGAPILLVAIAAVIVLFSLLPVLYLVAREGLDFETVRRFLHSPSTRTLTINTIELVIAVTILTTVIGVVLATLVSSTDLPGRRFWTVMFTLPLGVPAFVSSYTWVALSFEYAPRSRLLYSFPGVLLVLSLSLYPYVYLPTVAALRGLDASHEAVARSLGRSRFTAYLQVSLPLLRRPISGGALIIALHVVAEYGAIQLLRYQTLTTSIVQRALYLGAADAARALSLVLLALALIILAGDYVLLRAAVIPIRVGSGVAAPMTPWRLGVLRWPLLLASAAFSALALGAPLFGMLRGLEEIFFQRDQVDWTGLWLAARVTVLYAFLGAVVCSFLALFVSLLVTRYPSRLSIILERLAWISHSLPGVIIALALIYFSARHLHPIYQTSAVLIVGYSILYLPVAIGPQRAGLSQAQSNLEHVAQTLGAGSLGTFLRVTLPLALPGILAGAILVALNISKELTMTLLMRPTGVHTLATRLWSTTAGEVLDFRVAAPYALTLVLLTAAPTWLLVRTTLEPERR